MANKIYVGNLPASYTEKELYELFTPFGEVVSAEITVAMDGKSNNGYGYVTMVNDKDIPKAVQKLNNTLLKEKNLRVVKAHPIDQDSGYLARRNKFSRFSKFKKR